MPDLLHQVTLRQLEIFLAADAQGSFARAADALGLTQPAVSMQMSQLAMAIGLPLFEKQGRTLRLTPAGAALRPHAERMLQSLREAGEAVDALQGHHHGRVRVALVTTARYFVPRLLAQFSERHPEIDLDLEIANREGVIHLLEQARVDVAVMGRPPAHLSLVAQPFAEHPHGIVAAPSHALTARGPLQPQDLAAHGFLVREPGSGTRQVMEAYFAAHGVQPPVLRVMASNESLKQAVMAGLGLAFISLHTVELERRAAHLSLLDVQGLPVTRTWYVLHPARQVSSAATRAFLTFMTEDAPALMRGLFPTA